MMRAKPTRLIPVFSTADEAVVTELLLHLGDQVALVDSAPADGMLVVISQQAVGDPQWHAVLDAHQNMHIVPVILGQVKNAPSLVSDLNWISFDPQDLERTGAVISAAARSDTAHHRMRRALEADARVWALGGRQPGALMLDMGRIRALDAGMKSGDPLAQPNTLGADFLAASRKAAKKLRRRRFGKSVLRVAGAAIVAALFAMIIVNTREVLAEQRAAHVSDLGGSISPDLTASRSAAPLVGADDQTIAESVLAITVVEMLARDWPIRVLTRTVDVSLNGYTFTADGAITVHGDGVVAKWSSDFETGKILAKAGRPLYAVTVGRTSGSVAVADDKHVYRIQDAVITPVVDTGFTPEHLTMSDDGAVLAAATSTQVVAEVDGASEAMDVAYVLALVPAEDDVLILAADPTRITLTSLRHRSQVREWAHTWGEAVSLAAANFSSRDGNGYIAGPGRQLWAMTGSSLVPTGLPTATNPTSVTLAGDGRVIVASDEAGVRLYIPHIGIDAGQLCRLVDTPTDVTIAPDGRSIACTNLVQTVIEPTRRWTPVLAATDSTRVDPTQTSRVAVKRTGATFTFVSPDGSEYVFLRAASSAEVGPRDTIVVASGSTVFQVEMTSHGPKFANLGGVPGGGAVETVSWRGSDLIATTADGQEWTITACPGCLTTRAVTLAVAERGIRCFDAGTISMVPEHTRTTLDVRECPMNEIGVR